MEIPRSILKNLLLARRFALLSSEHTKSANETSLTIGVTLLQDAVEAFLLAVAEHVKADVSEKTYFDQYFQNINKRIYPQELPFRQRLTALNKMRVGAKHHGIVPSKSEVDLTVVSVKEFFREVSERQFGKSFESISLIDGLKSSREREVLEQAESAFLSGDYAQCLIECRKALYLRFEEDYEISQAINPRGLLGIFGAHGNKAPYWAKNQDYVDNYVLEPTDYIVFDHSKIELDLIKRGVSSVDFWNVWRLTPAVVKESSSPEWVVKTELAKLDEEGIKERAEYVLDTTVSMVYASDKSIAAEKMSVSQTRYQIHLRRDLIPVYKKASTNSEVVQTVPEGIRQVKVDFGVPGLGGAGYFWHVAHLDESGYISGFISEEDTDRD